jgi:hypothetical protein
MPILDPDQKIENRLSPIAHRGAMNRSDATLFCEPARGASMRPPTEAGYL